MGSLAQWYSGAKFSEDQPRDEGGRWTDSGGGNQFPSKLDKATAKAVENWQEHPHDLRLEAEKIVAGGKGSAEARLLLEKANNETEQEPLYRGLNFETVEERGAFLAGLGTGIDIPLASSSLDRETALQFANATAGMSGAQIPTGYGVLLEIGPGSSGFSTGPLPDTPIGAELYGGGEEAEVIISGRYEIGATNDEANHYGAAALKIVQATPIGRLEVPSP